jgi:hypothetical protein
MADAEVAAFADAVTASACRPGEVVLAREQQAAEAALLKKYRDAAIFFPYFVCGYRKFHAW